MLKPLRNVSHTQYFDDDITKQLTGQVYVIRLVLLSVDRW